MKVTVERWFNGPLYYALIQHTSMFSKAIITEKIKAETEEDLRHKINGYISSLARRFARREIGHFEIYEVTASGRTLESSTDPKLKSLIKEIVPQQ